MSSQTTVTKTKCSVSRDEFNRNAVALPVTLNGVPVEAEARQFNTGSMGWYYSGKMAIKLPSGQTVQVQVGLNLTVIGSKELPPAVLDAAPAAAVVQ